MEELFRLRIPLTASTNGTNDPVFTDETGDTLYRGNGLVNDSSYVTATIIRNITVPFICTMGVVGNTMAIVTFMYRRLRHTSFNFYLAIRSLSDTIFLLALLCVWFDSVEVGFFHTPVVCQLIVFTSYVSSFLSVWCVVATTFENYIRICHFSRVNQLCDLSSAKKVVSLFSVTAILFYQMSIWITKVHNVGGRRICLTNNDYNQLYLFITYADALFTFVLPLCTIMFLSCRIIVSVVYSYRRKIQLRNKMSSSNIRFSSTPQAKVTSLLLSVACIFLILHSPIHIMKIKLVIELYVSGNEKMTDNDAAKKIVFESMYYVNFAANFVIFFICGTTFRNSFWQLFCGRLCDRTPPVFRSVAQQTELTILNGQPAHKL